MSHPRSILKRKIVNSASGTMITMTRAAGKGTPRWMLTSVVSVANGSRAGGIDRHAEVPIELIELRHDLGDRLVLSQQVLLNLLGLL